MNRKNILVVLIFIFSISIIYSQQTKTAYSKDNIKAMIKKTALYVNYAVRVVKERKNFTGNLSKAVKNQKYAIMLYRRDELILQVITR